MPVEESKKEEAMNVMSVLKAEISRLAKKEAKAVVSPVKKASATYRGLIAGLRKQVDVLQKEVSSLKRAMPKADRVLATKTEPEGRFWITGKGVRAMRKRTGLTQEKFSKLVGVSVPTVVNWEKAKGKVDIRKKATMARLQGLKGKGKRAVAAIMGETEKAVKTEVRPKGKASPKVREKTRKTAPKKTNRKQRPGG